MNRSHPVPLRLRALALRLRASPPCTRGARNRLSRLLQRPLRPRVAVCD